MKVTILGVRKLDFLTKEGNPVKGRQVFIGFEANGVDGLQTEKVFLSDLKFGNVDVVASADYDIAYNLFGKVENISKL